MAHSQGKGLFRWFSIFPIGVSFNISEIEVSVFRAIAIELRFCSPRNRSNVFWQQGTFCLLWCRQTPVISWFLLPAYLSDMVVEFWHASGTARNCSVGLTAPWERQPYWLLAPKTNMSKTKLVCLLTWPDPPESPCLQQHNLEGCVILLHSFTSCPTSKQSRPVGLWVCISITALSSWCHCFLRVLLW